MDLQCKFNLISCLLNWYGRGIKSFGSNWIFSAKVLRHCFIQLTENCKRNDIKERKKTESCLTFFSYKLAITWILSPINRTVTVCFVSPKISQLKTAIDSDISTNIWSLHHSFHFHIEIVRPINISAATLSKENPNDSQITSSKSWRYQRNGWTKV